MLLIAILRLILPLPLVIGGRKLNLRLPWLTEETYFLIQHESFKHTQIGPGDGSACVLDLHIALISPPGIFGCVDRDLERYRRKP